VVHSFRPFYTKEALTDGTPLDGTWKPLRFFDTDVSAKDLKPWVFGHDTAIVHDERNAMAELKVTCFMVDDQLYCDVLAESPDAKNKPNEFWLFLLHPCHTLCKVELNQRTLTFRPLDYDWLTKRVEDKTIELPRLVGTPKGDTHPIFTASSEEWLAFLKRHGRTAEAFMKAGIVLEKLLQVPPPAKK
jgi:hypothetical protein